MKWIYRFFTILMLSAALIGPFFLDNQDGEAMLSMPDISDLNPSKLISSASIGSSEEAGQPNDPLISSSRTVFKWKDEHGVWHYGDQAPEQNATVSTLNVDTNTNIIQSLKIEPEVEIPPDTEAVTGAITPMPTKGEDFLTMDRAMNIMNDAKAVQGMMNSRNAQLKAITGE